MYRLMATIADYGLDQMREPHVKHLEGKMWELRAKASEGIARGIYVAAEGRRVIVLHAFEKKTQKTAEKDLNIARTAYAELKKNDTKNS